MGEAAPKVEIILDKTRFLQFTFGVAKKFKEMTGKPINEIDESMTFDEISTLMFLMLQVEDKDLTLEQCDDLLHVGNVLEYSEKIAELMKNSMPAAEGEDPKAPTNPTGSNSVPLVESTSA